MWTKRLFILLVLVFLIVPARAAKKKKKKTEEEQTQVLQLPKDPPNAVVADTGRLSFEVSPLTTKGLLSQQTREALKALLHQHHGAAIVKLRAFVAGTGDMRRVSMIVSETFTDKKLAIPALSVVQVGALPMDGAQIVLESTAEEKKSVNPNGVAFFSGQAAPTVDKSIEQLTSALAAAGAEPPGVMRVTCFVSSLDESHAGMGKMQSAFPGAALDLVQMQREPSVTGAECEAVARLSAAPPVPLHFVNSDRLAKSANYSQVAVVSAPKLVLTGTQLAFHDQESDIRLAFERLGKALEPHGASLGDVIMSHLYSLSRATADKVRAVRFEFYDKSRPPASTMLLFEGLPSLDASFAVEVIAVPSKP